MTTLLTLVAVAAAGYLTGARRTRRALQTTDGRRRRGFTRTAADALDVWGDDEDDVDTDVLPAVTPPTAPMPALRLIPSPRRVS